MAWTLTQLEELQAAIRGGALSVQYEDRKVTYRSLGDMLRLERLAKVELGLLAPGPILGVATTDQDLGGGTSASSWEE